jgi:hypothetical protein
MQKVTLTRHLSNYTNYADRMTVGDDTADPAALCSRSRTETYALPTGYSVRDRVIYDTAGYSAQSVCGPNGAIILVSNAGTCPDVVLKRA